MERIKGQQGDSPVAMSRYAVKFTEKMGVSHLPLLLCCILYCIRHYGTSISLPLNASAALALHFFILSNLYLVQKTQVGTTALYGFVHTLRACREMARHATALLAFYQRFQQQLRQRQQGGWGQRGRGEGIALRLSWSVLSIADRILD